MKSQAVTLNAFFQTQTYDISEQSALACVTTCFFFIFRISSNKMGTRKLKGHGACRALSSRSGQQNGYTSAVLPGMGSRRPGPFWHYTFLSSG